MDRDRVLEAFIRLHRINKNKKLDVIDTDRIPVSVEDVLSVISECCGYSITVNAVQYEGVHTRGLVEINPNKKEATIYFRASQTPYEQRFVVVKEASQLIVNSGPDDCSTYGVDTISGMLQDAYSRETGQHTEQPRPVQSDVLAEFVAIEIMYPYGCRMHDEVQARSAPLNYPTLAKKYEIPHFVIAKGLNPANMAISSDLWSKVYADIKASRRSA